MLQQPTVVVSDGSHEATVGQSLTLSCNTAPADWKKGSVTITNTDTLSSVFVMSATPQKPCSCSLPSVQLMEGRSLVDVTPHSGPQ